MARSDSRRKLVQSFSGIVQSRTPGASNANSYFQQRSISLQDVESIFGTPDDFMARYNAFHQKYLAALDTDINVRKNKKLLVNLHKKRGVIDLNLLNREAADKLATEFRDQVLRVQDIIQKLGLPGYELPSANLYRDLFKFNVDLSGGIEHPVQLLLSNMMLNFNANVSGIESISLGRSNIMSGTALTTIWDNLTAAASSGQTTAEFKAKQRNPFEFLGAGKKVIMFDTETTGVGPMAQIRSIAAREMRTGQNGELIFDIVDPNASVYNAGFKSPLLNGMKISTLNSGTESLSAFLARTEEYTLKEMGEGGEAFLDESVKFIERLLQADAVAGQNIGFDLDMLEKTMMAQEGLKYHTRAKKALLDLSNKRESGNFFIDTLQSARVYISDQAQEMTDLLYANADVDVKSAAFVRNLYAQETLAKVHIGGAAAYASVENIALNTNLFELIEKDQQAVELYDSLIKGSHIADTDVHLQSFISKYIQSGKLKIRSLALKDKEVFTEFGDWARKKIARSSAITATTNIADVSHLSNTVLQNLLTSEKDLRKVKISVKAKDLTGVLTASELQAIGADTGGVLTFTDGEFKFLTSKEAYSVSGYNAATSYIKQTIEDATKQASDPGVLINGTRMAAPINRAAESIIDLPITYGTRSAIEEIVNRGPIQFGSSRNFDDIAEAYSSVYREFGTGISVSDQIAYHAGYGKMGSAFVRGISDYTTEADRAVAQAFAKIGDPYAGVLDTRSRVISSILAEGTSQYAEEAYQSSIRAGRSAANLAFTSHANLTSSAGISYFKSQNVTRLFDLSSRSGEIGSKPLMHVSIVKAALEQANLGDKSIEVGLSVAKTKTRGNILNAVFDVSASLDRSESRIFAENLFDILSDSDKVSKIIGKPIEEFDKTLSDQIAHIGFISTDKAARDNAIDELHQQLMKNNIVIGSAEGPGIEGTIDELLAVDFDIQNDQMTPLRGRLLTTDLSDDVIAVGPQRDVQALRLAGRQAELNAAEEVVGSQSKLIKHVNEVITSVSDEAGGVKRLGKLINKQKYGLGNNQLLEFYMNNKKKIGIGLGIAAVAGAAYYVAKENRKNNLYDETLQQQPTERAAQLDNMISSDKQFASSVPYMQDPLATAGVVGNLDRQKIGHARMGKNKYNHLYGSN